MTGRVVIVRTVTFATEVPADGPLVAQFRATGGTVDVSLLPAVLLGRSPSAITSSAWRIEHPGGPSVQFTVNRSA